MRKVLSKIIILTVIAAFLLSITACGVKKSSTESTQSKENKEEKVSYEIFKLGSFPDYPSDGGKGKLIVLEKAAKAGIINIDFNVTYVMAQNYWNKLNVLAASSMLPDVFEVDHLTMRKFVEQELILDLSSFIKDMPNYNKKHPKDADSFLQFNGKTYALSTCYRPEPFNGNAMDGFVIRQDWLEKLNLKMPETIDQMYEIMKAFVANDPDGNGKNDTFGLGLAKPKANTGSTDSEILVPLFGAFGISPQSWMEKDGKLVKGFTLPEMKQALEVLHKWYKEKLIDPDFIALEKKMTDEKMVNSKYGIYSVTAFFIDPTSAINAALKKANPTAKVALIESPKGPAGKRGIPAGNAATSGANPLVFKANIKSPNRMIEYLDWVVNDEPDGGAMLIVNGIEGEHYTYDQKNNKISRIVSTPEVNKQGFGNPIRLLQVIDRRWMADEALAAANLTNKYKIENKFLGSVPAEVEYQELAKLYDEYFYKIMLGNLPLSSWDDFLKKYDEQGGKVINQQVNDEYKKIKK